MMTTRTTPLRTIRVALPVALTVLLLGAPAATAQDDEADRDNCICLDRFERLGAALDGGLFRMNRARIGILMGETAETDGGTGVVVEEVTPDGPAEAAGLQAGDVITEIDGEALGDEPNRGILDAMADVDPGETVTLTYYRDGRRRTADIVTDEMTAMTIYSNRGDGGFDVRGMPGAFQFRNLPGGGGRVRMATPRGMLWSLRSGLELVDVNPALGEYFGTDRGVLVAEVDEDTELGLEAGDVILSIDGREVRDAEHVRSILGSYRADEEVTFQVMREERRREVSGTVR